LSKIAIIGDMHFGIKGGNNDFLAFQEAWLEQALQKMQVMGIRTIVQTGDMFDTRQHIKGNILDFILWRFPKLLVKYGIDHWITYAGNHDIFYRDSNEKCTLDILDFLNIPDVLNFTVVKDEVKTLFHWGEKLAFVPWLNKNNSERLLNEVLSSKATYAFGHFEMMGMPMIPGVECEHGQDPKLFKNFKRVISGHFHTVSEYLNCTMVGTPYHLTWGDVQDGNNRGFWTLDVETDELVLHKNDDHMTLFSVIEYDPNEKYDDKSFEPYRGTISKILVKEKPDAKHYKKFIDLLAKAEMIDYKIIDTTMVEIEKVEISEEILKLDTLSAMNSFIDKQSDEFSKDNVKKLAKSIYMEALQGG